MPCSVFYSPEARDDIVNILDYISGELMNPAAAARIVRSIYAKIDLLADHPNLGRELPETVDAGFPCRHFTAENYRIFYRVDGTNIYVVRILHSLRNHMKALFDEE